MNEYGGQLTSLKMNQLDPYVSTSVDFRRRWVNKMILEFVHYGTNLMHRKQYYILFIDTCICSKNIKTQSRKKHTKF